MTRRRYRKRPDAAVTAVQLDLDTDGFSYRKWGEQQHCKRGDWLVDNDGEVYTIDADSFAATYRITESGRYLKRAPVWAEQAVSAGEVRTKEGVTRYATGDYLVANNADGRDCYAVSRKRFESMYEPFEPPPDTAQGQPGDTAPEPA